MFVRCAYYVGTVAPANRKTFDDYVLDVHLPDVASWPRLRRLRLLKNDGIPYLGEMPRYYQCFELSFDTQEDMDHCMASQARVDTRKQAAEDIDKFKGLFIGEVHHVNYEVTDIPITASE
jgi:uncharacterized protein (TIGR02118 family)